LAAYAAFKLFSALSTGMLCFQSRCAQRGNPDETFVGYAVLYGMLDAYGLVSAWRSMKGIRAVRSKN
jgi:hypothetical protein